MTSARSEFLRTRANCNGNGCRGNPLHLLACDHAWCQWMKSTLHTLGSGSEPTWPTDMPDWARHGFLELVRLRALRKHIAVSDLSKLLEEMSSETREEVGSALIDTYSLTTASDIRLGDWPDNLPFRNPRPQEPLYLYSVSPPHQFMTFRAPRLIRPPTEKLVEVLPPNIQADRVLPPRLPVLRSNAAICLDRAV